MHFSPATISSYVNNVPFLARFKGRNQTVMLALLGVAVAGCLALAAGIFFPRPEQGPDVSWRTLATSGGAALGLAGGGGAYAFYANYNKRWAEAQAAINQAANQYMHLSLAPRTDQKPVDPSKMGLWRKLGAYVERADEWPSQHLCFGWMADQDRVHAVMAVPPEMRHSMGVQINAEFVGADVVEMAASPGDVPFGDEDEVMVDFRHCLEHGEGVHWNDLVLTGDDTLIVFDKDALKQSNFLAALLSLLDGVPAGETWGFQILVRSAPPDKAGSILQAVETRQMQARGGPQQAAAPISSVERGILQAREAKGNQTLFEVVLRTWVVAPDPQRARSAVEQISRLLMAQIQPGGRGAALGIAQEGTEKETVSNCHWPAGVSAGVWGHQELAGLFYLPGSDVAPVSSKLVTARARKLPPTPAIRRPEGQARDDLLVLGTYRYPNGEVAEVGVPWNDTKVHLFVVGPTGSGKSTTLGNAVLQYVERGATVVLMEPHGDLVNDVAETLPPELAARTIYVDPLSWAPPSMNICAVGANDQLTMRVERTMEILQAASGEDWSRMVRVSEITRHGLTVVMDALGERACLVDLRRLITDEDWREQQLDKVGLEAQESKTYWRDQFLAISNPEEAVAPVMRRLSPILNNAIMRPLLGLPANTLDVGGFLDEGKLVLVPLMAGMLRSRNKNTLGTLVMQQILTAILSRAGTDKKARGLVGIFIDEFPDFIGSTGETVNVLLAQARKFGASVVLAAQSLSQLAANPAVMTEVETNCRNKVVYASDAKDSRRAVELLGAGRLLTPDDMVSVGKFRGYVRPTYERAPVPPAYVRFLPPVGEIERPSDGRKPTSIPMPDHPGKEALELALKAYKVYQGYALRGSEAAQTGREKVAEFLSDLPDSDWEAYRAGRRYLFTYLYNQHLSAPIPRDKRSKVKRMKELTAFLIGVPVYEQDAEYRRRVKFNVVEEGWDWGGGDDLW